jgi:Flp pilus assembly protein TadG
MRGRWRDEDGETLVEFALSTVLLLTVVFGVMNVCLALFEYQIVAQSARDGSRYAMVRGNTCTASGASCTATVAQIQSYVQNEGYPGIVPASMSVAVSYSAFPTGGTCSPNANCTNPGNLVTVKVTYPFVMHIPFTPANSLSLTSSSSMVISQ